jgi:hypothetical protein
LDAQLGQSSQQGGVCTRKRKEALVGRLSAQGLIEYGLIIALVAVLAIAGLVLFGPAINSLLSNVTGSV